MAGYFLFSRHHPFLFNHCSAEHAACSIFPGLTGEGELFAHLFTYSISGLLCRFFSPVPGFFGCFFGSVPGFLCIFLYLISCTHLSTIPETVLRLLLFFLNTMFSLVRCFFCPVRYFFGLLTGLVFLAPGMSGRISQYAC
ncbi:TPA: hypothetical protein N6224_004358 [Escherichia coli]|nr:hypothetical protein [Escherichia coli]